MVEHGSPPNALAKVSRHQVSSCPKRYLRSTGFSTQYSLKRFFTSSQLWSVFCRPSATVACGIHHFAVKSMCIACSEISSKTTGNTKIWCPIRMSEIPERVKAQMRKNGLTAINKPKRTPSHPTKAGVVMAKEGQTYRLVRYGQQGADPAGRNPQGKADKAKRKAYYARHDAQDPNPSKLSPRFWSHRERW
jgi:hypothetical protein